MGIKDFENGRLHFEPLNEFGPEVIEWTCKRCVENHSEVRMKNEIMEFVVPMYESERGWGAKIDGYAGPFPTFESASSFADSYNRKNNSEERVPDYYISALKPVERRGVECVYKTTIDGVDFADLKARRGSHD
jgi:hypothetical protein